MDFITRGIEVIQSFGISAGTILLGIAVFVVTSKVLKFFMSLLFIIALVLAANHFGLINLEDLLGNVPSANLALFK